MNVPGVVQIDSALLVNVADDAPTLPRLWSARSLAERLDVSRGTICNLYRSGRLRAYRLDTGGPPERQPLRFAEADVIKLLLEVKR